MGSRILLADDSITIQKVVNVTFADEGIEVVAVSNGDLAERRLSEVRPDLVLADIFMPGKNGYELCEAIKENPQYSNIPVVLLVGAFEPFDQAEARRVRADAHLTKPFESRTLVETVRRLINASVPATTGPIAGAPAEEPAAVREAALTPPPLAAQSAAKLDLSAMMVDRNAAHVVTSPRNTGELTSPSPVQLTEIFEKAPSASQHFEVVNTHLVAPGEIDEPLTMPSIGEFQQYDQASPHDMDSQSMILDFDKAEPFESATPQRRVSFGTEAINVLDTNPSGLSEDPGWFSRDSLETRALEAPSQAEARQASAIHSPLSGQMTDVGGHSKSTLSHSSAVTESAQVALLAVDDPLGDVLLDDMPSPGTLPMASDSLDIEFAEPALTTGVGSTQFDLIETVAAASAPVSVEVEENSKGQPTSRGDETLTFNDMPTAPLEGSHEGPQSPSASAGSVDWTSPRAGVYSTAQLDSVMMPIGTAEYLRAHSTNNDVHKVHKSGPIEEPGKNIEEAAFDIAASWPEDEARFSAIDIEAFPVEEPILEEPAASARGMSAAETGFSLSSLDGIQPLDGVEPAVVAALPSDGNDNARGRATAHASAARPPQAAFITPAEAQRDREALPQGASSVALPQAGELSSAAIDEIVRRVVAEMSSEVVREVAWEVVPDCVERVIDQLTRESLSRRA